MAAGAAAGVGIGGVISKALETEALDTTIELTFELDDKGTQVVKEAINTVKGYGVDSEAALDGVRRQWSQNADLSDEVNARIVKGAGMITHAYGEIDFTELIQETNEMASEMGMTQEQALAMTNQLLKAGFPPDQIDIISEYGSQLARAGYSWEEIQGIINSGANVDSWNIDNLLDGLQEGRILISEFGGGVDEATQKLLQGTGISTEQLQKWGEAVAAGGETGKTAYNEVAEAMAGIADKDKQNLLGVKLYGTMWETQGTKITDTILNASDLTANAGENQKALNEDVNNLDSSPIVMLNDAIGKMNEVLQPIYDLIAKVVAKMAEWASANPELAAAIAAVVVGIGLLIAICLALMPVFSVITGLAGALGVAVGTVAAPFLITIAVILAVIAIGVLLWQNWDVIKKKAGELATKIKEKFEEFKKAVAEKMAKVWEKIQEIWGKVTAFFEDIDLKKIGKDIISGLIKGIGEKATELYNKASEIAGKVVKTLKGAFKTKSPSEITEAIGEDVGDGLVVGLGNTMSNLQKASISLADAVVSTLQQFIKDSGGALTKYFDAIREDGDWMNDWLTHLPKQYRTMVLEMGKTLAPQLEGTLPRNREVVQKPLTVNIHSPKAVDAREASKVFNRQLSKMAVLW